MPCHSLSLNSYMYHYICEGCIVFMCITDEVRDVSIHTATMRKYNNGYMAGQVHFQWLYVDLLQDTRLICVCGVCEIGEALFPCFQIVLHVLLFTLMTVLI